MVNRIGASVPVVPARGPMATVPVVPPAVPQHLPLPTEPDPSTFGLAVEGNVDFGLIDVADTTARINFLTLTSHGLNHWRVRVIAWPPSPNFQLHLDGGRLDGTLLALRPQLPVRIQVVFSPNGTHGVFRQPIVFQFLGPNGAVLLTVARKAIATVSRLADQKRLSAEAVPFYPAHLRTLFDSAPAIRFDADQLPLPSYVTRETFPGLYPIPPELLGPPAEISKWLPARLGALTAASGPVGYARHMHALLWIEEVQMLSDIKAFDLFNTPLPVASPGGPPHMRRLRVPGLPEKRPDVAYGDVCRVRVADEESVEYIAFVAAVQAAQATLVLSLPLPFAHRWPHAAPPPRCHVRFTFCRMSIRRMHQAVNEVSVAGAVPLFPDAPPPLPIPPRPPRIRAEEAEPPAEPEGYDEAAGASGGEDGADEWDEEHDGPCFPVLPTAFPYGEQQEGRLSRRRHPSLEETRGLNAEQLESVARCVLHAPLHAPFVVHGPVGTGKTLTAVEIVLQALNRSPGNRVLAVAPSGGAADTLCSRLALSLGRGTMLRLNSFQRPMPAVFAAALPFCTPDPDTALFDVPPLPALLAFRVVVCTCAEAGILRALGVPPGHFSHILCDEGGQAMEPEALIPLTLAVGAPRPTRVVLAGDHRQLGPVVRSPLAIALGLQTSLHERLLSHGPYARRDKRFSTTLLRNYRSQPELLKVPGRLFYEDRLVACAAKDEALAAWPELPTPGSMLFYSVLGEDRREADSPSLENRLEASCVVDLVERLLGFQREGGPPVSTNDIGVLAPYRRQVRAIRLLLRSRGLNAIRVGSVDDYQGQEERVVIVSTVVARKGRIAAAREQRLGFLRDPRSFNVAVTRARALLVVVGHAEVLCEDDCWRALVEHAARIGAYKGAPCPVALAAAGEAAALDGGIDELARAMAERLLLGREEEVFAPLEDLPRHYADQDDLEWRVVR